MEIIFEDANYIKNSKKILKDVNLKINKNTLTGLYGNNKSIILDLIDLTKNLNEGFIKFDNNLIDKENINYYRQKIGYIKQIQNQYFYTNNLLNEVNYIKENLNYKFDIIVKIKKTLKIVGLSNDYLTKPFNSLSTGEIKLIQIALNMITNPKVFLFDEPFENLDLNNYKNILKLINRLIKEYNKTVIIASNDVDMLYELTKEVIIIKDNKVVASGSTTEVFENTKIFYDNNLLLPRIVKFKELATKKKVNLLTWRNINDLIKDVFKNV